MFLEHQYNVTQPYHCQGTNVMTSLVANASPFLFPCTIEYSLICAVILLEMWKEVKTVHKTDEKKDMKETRVVFVSHQEKVTNVYNFRKLDNDNVYLYITFPAYFRFLIDLVSRISSSLYG